MEWRSANVVIEWKFVASHLNCVDQLGQIVVAGDDVVLSEAPLALLRGLPKKDQLAIKAQVGKRLKLNEFDIYGNAELEFLDEAGGIHFIWVEPRYLVKQKYGQM